jgi:hypothetical protein
VAVELTVRRRMPHRGSNRGVAQAAPLAFASERAIASISSISWSMHVLLGRTVERAFNHARKQLAAVERFGRGVRAESTAACCTRAESGLKNTTGASR